MSLLRTLPTESEPPPPSLLVCGIGTRFAIASVACALLWLTVFWALT
ncbi:MAG: hypothetical protein LBE22_12885 [Azoarcus sp.]|jgi:hypothetical protein|nr:hypothetical protein [Azoarcus sp.]